MLLRFFAQVVALYRRLKTKENLLFNVTRNLRRNQSVILNNKAARKIIFGNVNRFRFIQIPCKRLKEDARTQVNNSTFIFISDKVLDRVWVPGALTSIANRWSMIIVNDIT